jgi:hypothetical protein
MTQRFQAELEQAKELARLQLEHEHLENLRQLGEGLEQKQAQQLKGLTALQDEHVAEKQLMKKEHDKDMEQ